MKYLRCAGALALLLVLLLALPALAEGDARMDETSDTFCGATGGVHQVKEWTVTVEPSCMVGLRKGYCEACQMMCNDVIPATGEHLWDKGTVTTAPTCEGEGVKTYNCIMCNDATKTEPIAATGHSWDAGVETTAPTCTAAGVKTFTCTVCGETKTEEIPALNHDFSVEVTPEVPATCETAGTTAVMQCSRCNETEGGDPIPAPGHTVTTWELVEKATCSTEGKETGVCDVCGETVEQAIPIDPVAHAFDDGVETPATCTVDGKVVYTCKLCNATQEVAIPAPGHAWDAGVETTAPGCETEGVKTYTCTACGDTRTEPIPATGHTWDAGVEITAPSCETEGVKLYTCTACDLQAIEVIPALGHTPDAGKVTKEPTCTENGVKTYTCTVCGKHLDEAIPAEGHEWGKWVTLRAATEDQPGEQERTCQVCGAKQTREVDYQGDMPKTGVFTVPTAWLVAALALSLTGYIALKRKSERG